MQICSASFIGCVTVGRRLLLRGIRIYCLAGVGSYLDYVLEALDHAEGWRLVAHRSSHSCCHRSVPILWSVVRGVVVLALGLS